jgi:hypothetical protein
VKARAHRQHRLARAEGGPVHGTRSSFRRAVVAQEGSGV